MTLVRGRARGREKRRQHQEGVKNCLLLMKKFPPPPGDKTRERRNRREETGDFRFTVLILHT
eukprot:2903426-Ditylum_brightwellii.AAC.1